jgi:phosphatidate cytidylyltransferase
MVTTRIFFGCLLIVAVVGVVALDAWLTQQTIPDWPWLSGSLRIGVMADFLLHGALMTALLAIVIGWGVLEMGRLFRSSGTNPAVGWSCFATIVFVALPWLAVTPLFGDRSSLAGWEAAGQWLAVCVLVSVVWILVRGETQGALANMAATIWLIVYLGFFGSFASRLRIDVVGPAGSWLVLYFIGVVKFADIGAYFTGVAIGRHKIVPKISPNKTLEGYIGGLVVAAGVSVALAWLVGIIVPRYEGLSSSPWLTSGQAVVFGLVMGLLGQVGDLIESLVKRDAQIKDSGSLVPTFGGVLDIIDSPLLAAPVAWWMLTGWLA